MKEELVVLPKHEQNADLDRYRAVRYEPEPEIWQTVACTWDQLQSRPNQFYQYESDKLFPAIYTSTTRYVYCFKNDDSTLPLPWDPCEGRVMAVGWSKETLT